MYFQSSHWGGGREILNRKFPIVLENLTFDAGAGIFVTTVVAGSIAVVRPFKAMERPFLRDVIFYMSAVFFTFYVLYDKKITLAESLGKVE